jgi:hypothetical protein
VDDAIESSSGSKLSNWPESSSDNSKWGLETLSVPKMIRFDGRRAIESGGVDSKGARTLGVFWKDHHMGRSWFFYFFIFLISIVLYYVQYCACSL